MNTEQKAICEICSSEQDILTFHQFIGKNKNITRLCKTCAQRLGIQKKSDASLTVSDLFSELLDPDGSNERNSKYCEKCGTTYVELCHNLLAGCSECYDWLGEEITLLRRDLNAPDNHRGRLPKRLRGIRDLFVEKPHLHREFHKALKREDYEDAHRIQAKIEQIDKNP